MIRATRVVVVGAGHAGATFTALIRQAGFTGEVVALGDEPDPPYHRPPLSKEFLRGPVEKWLRDPRFYAEHDVTLRLGETVVRIDRQARRVATARDEETDSFYTRGFWGREGLFDLVEAQAAARAHKLFVSDGTTSVTYAELRDRAVRLAHGLTGLGVGRGDRVAVQLPNWTEFVTIAVALARLGAVLVPVMPIYRAEEVGYVLDHSGAKAAITCAEFKGFRHADMFDALRADHPRLNSVVVVRGPAEPGPAIAFEQLMSGGELAELDRALGERPSPDDGLLVVYTSGTTSRPKGCFHTFNTLRATSVAIAKALRYRDSDVQFGPSPVTHSTGLVTSVVLPLLAGASSHLVEAWEPGEGLQRIAKYGCTVAVTATAFLQMLTAAYDPDRHDAGSLRVWVCAGSPIPGAIVRRASELLPGCRILSLYGRSENMTTTMCTVDDPPERSATSDGSALPGASVRIVDESGAEVPRGAEGDIAYSGPSHMLGYYRDPEQTAALFTPDGYSRSGDLGVMDQDGYVRVTGRLKDIVIRGGLNISARELEDLLIDQLPVTATGKVQKYVLREDVRRKLP